MTVDAVLAELGELPGVVLGESAEGIEELLAEVGPLPDDHRALLARCNGLTVADGYVRLFGVGPRGLGDMGRWNEPATWKFAWPNPLEEYLCIGEDGWGNQFAYRRDQLDHPDPPLLQLGDLTMAPGPLGATFGAYLRKGLLPNARSREDPVESVVRARLGPLPIDQHIVHSPSILLGAEEDPDTVVAMPATTAMILNGDVYRHLSFAPPGAVVERTETWVDDAGRPRLRLVFAE